MLAIVQAILALHKQLAAQRGLLSANSCSTIPVCVPPSVRND